MKSNRPIDWKSIQNKPVKKWRWWHITMLLFIAWMFIGMIYAMVSPSSEKKEISKKESLVTKSDDKQTIEELCNKIKKDTLYRIKDVYYNKEDSSLNIAFTNKDNAIKDKSYSTDYFNNTYHIDTMSNIDGVTLYAYKRGNSLKQGDYKTHLTLDSKRASIYKAAFKEKYCSAYYCWPLKAYIKTLMNDPDSFEEDRLWVEWNNGKTFIVTMTYRGRNGFGGLVLNKASAIVDMSGNVTDFKEL